MREPLLRGQASAMERLPGFKHFGSLEALGLLARTRSPNANQLPAAYVSKLLGVQHEAPHKKTMLLLLCST